MSTLTQTQPASATTRREDYASEVDEIARSLDADLASGLSSEQFAARLGQQNRQRVHAHFSHDSMVENYRNLYREVLAKATPTALYRPV